jgi:hypothetical protein
MKEKVKFICPTCSSPEVEIKVWADPNTNEITDSDNDGDNNDTWCRKCQSHTGITTEAKYEEGDDVFWEDPDEGKSSGIYKVIKVEEQDGDDSVYLVSNGSSETEVYQRELK